MKLVQTQFDLTHRTRRNGSSVHELTKEYNGVPFIRIGCVKLIEIVLIKKTERDLIIAGNEILIEHGFWSI